MILVPQNVFLELAQFSLSLWFELMFVDLPQLERR